MSTLHQDLLTAVASTDRAFSRIFIEFGENAPGDLREAAPLLQRCGWAIALEYRNRTFSADLTRQFAARMGVIFREALKRELSMHHSLAADLTTYLVMHATRQDVTHLATKEDIASLVLRDVHVAADEYTAVPDGYGSIVNKMGIKFKRPYHAICAISAETRDDYGNWPTQRTLARRLDRHMPEGVSALFEIDGLRNEGLLVDIYTRSRKGRVLRLRPAWRRTAWRRYA